MAYLIPDELLRQTPVVHAADDVRVISDAERSRGRLEVDEANHFRLLDVVARRQPHRVAHVQL